MSGELEDMPRQNRILVEGGVYHVYNRLGRGERAFDQEMEAAAFVELLGKVKKPIVDVDEVLRVFGTTRRSARAAYARRLKGSFEEEWIGEEPGRLPWWRLGRPAKGEDEDPEAAIRESRDREELGPEWRPSFEAEEFLARGAESLGVDIAELRSRRRAEKLVRARELLMILGVERFGLKVKDLAKQMCKSPDGMTQTIARAARKRTQDTAFRRELNKLDRALAETEERKQ